MNTIRPRIAAISIEGPALTALRLKQPLQSLHRQGLIEGFNIFQFGEFNGPSRFSEYDVIWVQRAGINTPQFCTVLIDNSIRFLLDLDDLLIYVPQYSETREPVSISMLIEFCEHLSSSNNRLMKILEKRCLLALEQKTTITPNGLLFPRGEITGPVQPTAIMWTSSDFPAVTSSMIDISRAIDDFSQKYNIPVYLAGKFREELCSFLRKPFELGFLDFWEHKAFLAAHKTMIPVSPLESDETPDTLEFIASKSDLKMVEYGGFGHFGVYSSSPAYVESDLDAGHLVENTYDDWFAALENIYASEYKKSLDIAAYIRSKRHIDKLARDCWLPAIQAVVMNKPVSHERLERLLKVASQRPFLQRAYSSFMPNFFKKRLNPFLKRFVTY